MITRLNNQLYKQSPASGLNSFSRVSLSLAGFLWGDKMRITKIDNEYYVFRNGIKPTMSVVQMRSGEFIRSDTGILGDKTVPIDIQKKIRKFQNTK
jgi:hypothetical protein